MWCCGNIACYCFSELNSITEPLLHLLQLAVLIIIKTNYFSCFDGNYKTYNVIQLQCKFQLNFIDRFIKDKCATFSIFQCVDVFNSCNRLLFTDPHVFVVSFPIFFKPLLQQLGWSHILIISLLSMLYFFNSFNLFCSS